MYLTQRQKVLKALQEAGEVGINSFDARHLALQLPTRIKEIKQEYAIKTTTNPDRSVTYRLLDELKDKDRPFKYEYIGNTARKIYL